MPYKFHKFWLIITAVVVGSFGPVFFLGTMVPTSEPARLSLDILSWPIDGIQTCTDPTMRFLSALTGGFLFGWGVMIWCMRAWLYDVAPEAVRRSVLVGLLSWFFWIVLGRLHPGTPRTPFLTSSFFWWRLDLYGALQGEIVDIAIETNLIQNA